jgi:hypothetical protein
MERDLRRKKKPRYRILAGVQERARVIGPPENTVPGSAIKGKFFKVKNWLFWKMNQF